MAEGRLVKEIGKICLILDINSVSSNSSTDSSYLGTLENRNGNIL